MITTVQESTKLTKGWHNAIELLGRANNMPPTLQSKAKEHLFGDDILYQKDVYTSRVVKNDNMEEARLRILTKKMCMHKKRYGRLPGILPHHRLQKIFKLL